MQSLKYQPLISVVVPVYNICDYVGKCIESIIAQSYKKLEIILVDDGSTDGSGKLCDEYTKKDSRILVIHSENKGLVHARRIGLNLSTGDYILNVDGDDWIEEHRVIHIVEQLQNIKPDMLYMGGYIRDFVDEHTLIYDNFEEKTFYEDNLRSIFPLLQSPVHAFQRTYRGLLWQWCIKRELCLMAMIVDESISMGEDLLGIWLCTLKANCVHVFYEPSYHYVQRPRSLTWKYDPCEKQRMWLLKSILFEAVANSEFRYDELVLQSAIKACFLAFALSDFSLMLKGSSEYLFPFSKVMKGSRIVVYGAGKVGFHICNAIELCGGYEIVAVCDQNVQRPAVCGKKVKMPEAILQADYDFVVIAVLYERLAKDIENNLLEMGIMPEKIARMDPSVMTAEKLDKIFSESNLTM